jgi:hypothetical protein
VYTRLFPAGRPRLVCGAASAVLAVSVALTSPSAVAARAAGPPDDSQPLSSIAAVTSVSHVDPVMSTAASQLAGHATVVRCLSGRDWATLAQQVIDAGLPDWGGTYTTSGAVTVVASLKISMSPDLCSLIARFTYRRYYPVNGWDRTLLANAVATLAHEAENVRLFAAGTQTDAVAECYAMQETAPLTRLLRSTVKPATARALALLAWTQVYPRMPDSYRSPDCRDGGPLDLNPSSSVWP